MRFELMRKEIGVMKTTTTKYVLNAYDKNNNPVWSAFHILVIERDNGTPMEFYLSDVVYEEKRQSVVLQAIEFVRDLHTKKKEEKTVKQ